MEIIAPIILRLVDLAIELWRNHSGKSADWNPTPEDWAELRLKNAKTVEDYEAGK